ncbi:MAG: Gfo/Idh/MocA family oxidoreductase [Myxococcota bacterium]|nr:Gfo/Idh/MocA family oxidoreductase [Myxococcota bacterium]
MSERTRYAVVGTGARAGLFIDAAARRYAQHAELVGLCDVSSVRMAFWNRLLEKLAAPVPAWPADRFDEMLATERPDVVVVTTVDATHHDYIVRSLEAGCDVVTEKPMTTDAEKARAILEAAARTGRRVRVAFNYRFHPAYTALREVIRDGRIGEPLLVDFQWVLDTTHGADYFRRWHREKQHSGGLLVHKATHHFDLVNFWIQSIPEWVVALGSLSFYGKDAAERRGEARPYTRYTGVEAARDDPFRLSLDENDGLRGLYLEAEAETGYLRDRDVFGEGISIEDTMGVLARYRSGCQLHYSLVAYAPWEGMRVCITGSRGRVELFHTESTHLMRGQSDAELGAEQRTARSEVPTQGTFLHCYPMFGAPEAIAIGKAEGGHGGGDARLLAQIFDPDAPPDPLGRGASERDGAASIALGVAANRSIATGGPVLVSSLLDLDDPTGGPG